MSQTEKQGVVVRDGFVVVNELADRMGLNRSACRRAVIKAGLTPSKRRLVSTGGQSVNVITREEAEQFLRDRQAEFLTGDRVAILAVG